MALLAILGSILLFLFILTVLVLVHELGHFWAAKLCGVKVTEFGIGLPPKAKRLFKKGDTEYTLNYLPLGGFVRLYGEDDVSGKLAKKPNSFSAQPVWKRMFIASAGVIMNFILAFVILTGVFWAGFTPISIMPDEMYPFTVESYTVASQSFAEEQGILVKNPEFVPGDVTLAKIEPDSVASTLGLTEGMVIQSLNEEPVESAQTFHTAISAVELGEEVRITTSLNGAEQSFTYIKEEPLLGVYPSSPSPYMLVPYQAGLLEAPVLAAKEVGTLTVLTFEAVGTFFVSVFTQLSIPEDIGGPVQIAEVVHRVNMELGLGALILISALLSINLGVLNIMPFPALDGGRIAFMVWEVVTRKKPSPAVEGYVHIIGYGILLMLIVLITYKDIISLLSRL